MCVVRTPHEQGRSETTAKEIPRSKCGKGYQQNKTAAKWKEKLILELEEAFDRELGPYNEADLTPGIRPGPYGRCHYHVNPGIQG
jgi:hypothetical protein